MRIAVVGAGVLGRLTALGLREAGHEIDLFDRGGPEGQGSASFAAAGMLAPYCELETAEREVFELGVASLELWPQLIARHRLTAYFQREGSLVVAHGPDLGELERFRAQVTSKVGEVGFRDLADAGLAALEPELDRRFSRGIYFPFEGQIDARAVLAELGVRLSEAGVRCEWGLELPELPRGYDWVIDTRGLGAKQDLPTLRGVRGELVYVHAPGVRLRRPVRVMHPRYPLYVVPRPDEHYLIGATAIESEDTGPVTLRSALELLSAAYSLHSGFSEARILDLSSGVRPVLPDHQPRIELGAGLIRVNGLFRHGYLMSPKLAELVCGFLETGAPAREFLSIFTEGER